jgi:hypothetical protein
MAPRSYLSRIAQPLAAADPVVWSTPRASADEARPAVQATAADTGLPPSRTAAYPLDAPARGPSPPQRPAQTIAASPAPIAASARPPRPALGGYVVSSSVPAGSPTDGAPVAPNGEPEAPTQGPVDRPPVHAAAPERSAAPRATSGATARASVADATPRLHIGAIEVRLAPPPPAPPPPARSLPAAPAAPAPLARAYASRFGLAQG